MTNLLVIIFHVLFIILIKIYLRRKNLNSAVYNKNTLITLIPFALNIGIKNIFRIIKLFLTNKTIKGLDLEAMNVYSTFDKNNNFKKESINSQFEYIIFILLLLIIIVIIVRILKFSLIIPIKSILQMIAYSIFGYDLSTLVDMVNLYYIPRIKGLLNEYLWFNFEINEEFKGGWTQNSIKRISEIKEVFETLREIKENVFTDNSLINDLESILPKTDLPNNDLNNETNLWEFTENIDNIDNKNSDEESDDSINVNNKYLLSILLIAVVGGYIIYHFYGDSIYNYYKEFTFKGENSSNRKDFDSSDSPTINKGKGRYVPESTELKTIRKSDSTSTITPKTNTEPKTTIILPKKSTETNSLLIPKTPIEPKTPITPITPFKKYFPLGFGFQRSSDSFEYGIKTNFPNIFTKDYLFRASDEAAIVQFNKTTTRPLDFVQTDIDLVKLTELSKIRSNLVKYATEDGVQSFDSFIKEMNIIDSIENIKKFEENLPKFKQILDSKNWGSSSPSSPNVSWKKPVDYDEYFKKSYDASSSGSWD